MAKDDKGAAEMPFLDHLEELRWRLIWSLLALLVGMAIGFTLVLRFDLLEVLQSPIAPYLKAHGWFIPTRAIPFPSC